MTGGVVGLLAGIAHTIRSWCCAVRQAVMTRRLSADDDVRLPHVDGGRLFHVIDGVAVALCGSVVCHDPRRNDRAELLSAIHSPATYRVVASRVLLAAVSGGLAGTVAGGGLVVALGFYFGVPVGGVSFSLPIPLLVVVSAIVAFGLTLGLYELRWHQFAHRAAVRERRINATLPRAVAFMYALSRSGMPFPAVLRTLAAHEEVYGETAVEFALTVREMDRFGTDCITALETTSEHTPATQLAEFTEHLASVLRSGQPIEAYLQSQHERYREQAEAQQQPYFDLLSAAAEGYVTVLVVAPLFLVTILSIVGLVVTDTLGLLRVITVFLPLATVGFLAGLNRLLASYRLPTTDTDDSTQQPTMSLSQEANNRSASPTAGTAAVAEQRHTLQLYDRLAGYRRLVSQPRQALLRTPSLSLAVTVPLGVAWLIFTTDSLPTTPVAAALSLSVATVAIGVCAGYAVVYEHATRRRRRLEQAVPAFLDLLANNNESGHSIMESLRSVADSDIALTPALEAMWRDIQWGVTADTALEGMASRIRSPSVTGAVTLLRNALHASSNIAPVVTIAASELRARQRRHRQQRQLMLSYLVVIYIAFLVFLGIIAALSAAFIPALETAAQHPTQGSPVAGVAGGSQPTAGTRLAYEALFVQIAIVQAVCSGLVAGRLGEGSIRAGVKHVGILLTLAVVAFHLL